MKLSRGEKIFSVVNAIILTVVSLAILLPFTHVLAISLSSREYVAMHRLTLFFPNLFQLDVEAYKYILNGSSNFLRSFNNTVFITVVGTALELAFVLFMAYPLSRKQLKYKPQLMLFIFIPMIVNPGIIPNFIIVKETHLMNSLWSLIIPNLASAFNILLAINFFKTIPDSLEESAFIDGAGHFTIATRIILPMSLPVIASVTIFTAVGQWNTFFNAFMYLNDSTKFTLQVLLYQMVSSGSPSSFISQTGSMYVPPGEQIQMAAVVITALPIAILYPFIQRYYIKGITLGSVKG